MVVIDVTAIRMRYEAVAGHLDERARRLFAAREARAAGRGGIAAVSLVTGIARSTIERGLKDLDREAAEWPYGRIRRSGGGRKAATVEQPGLRPALRRLVASATRGDQRAALLWVSRSQRQLAAALAEQGYRVSPNLVGRLLKGLGFSLQETRKGRQHPDRDAQFQHINAAIEHCRRDRQPAISVDTKKNDFKNAGGELRRKGRPQTVRVREFVIASKGRARPYGVYDVAANQGWASVGIDHDTAAFTVESIRRWLRRMGRKRYPKARRLLITADCGRSNGARVRLWKLELQELANHTGLGITVAHHPAGTSKWNRIEHRMFAFVSQNWRGKPVLSHKVIVQLIGATKTASGPTITCAIDAAHDPEDGKITDAQLDALNVRYDAFHPDWNYTLLPQ
jgi:Rhodopirellula transposase DDE domain